MATMKDLALKIHQRTSRYTNLNQQIQDNAGNINTNLSKISTIEGQVQELQAKANALRGYKEYNANEAYSVGDIVEAEGLFKVIKAITAGEEHPELSDQEYFVNLTYTLDDLDALISRLDTELGSLAEIAGQIEFDTVELGGNTYPLVMKKPIPPAPFYISTDTITLKQGKSSEIQFTNDGCTLVVTTDYNLVNAVQNSNSLGLTAVTDDMGSDRLRIVATKEGFTPKTVEITVIVPDVTIECDPLAISIDGDVDEYKDVVVTTNGDDISYSVNNDNCSVELLSTSQDGLTKTFRVTGESDGGSVITFNALVDGNVVETCTCGVTLSNIVNEQVLAFTVGANISNVNMFACNLGKGFNINNLSNFNVNNFDVYINNVKTSQKINSLTANVNDKIIIRASNENVHYFPYPMLGYVYCSSIDAPFPTFSSNGTSSDSKIGTEYVAYSGVDVSLFYPINNCSITTLPNKLFKNNSQATTIRVRLDSLTTVPNDLFKYNTQATNITLHYTKITSIPNDFFKYNTSVTTISLSLNQLTTIPNDLFKYNTEVQSFYHCFHGAKITSIPQDLFKYNTKATNFEGCFYGCSNVTSAVPELWVSHPNASSRYCFAGCTNASNYASIPEAWRT